MSDKSVDPKKSSKVALMWGNSQLWGVLLWRGLRALGAEVVLLSCQDIANGSLQRLNPAALFVPGGWARQRSWRLRRRGRHALREYVRCGGVYIGFCGGAGLALQTSGQDGLDLCPCQRKPIEQRLINCSGHLRLQTLSSHPLVPRFASSLCSAPVWWPSQFSSPSRNDVSTLAKYQRPEADFWVADLALADIPDQRLTAWEKIYQINLDPRLLYEEPAVVTGRFGSGRYVLSYLHLETPASAQANQWLGHILSWATGQPSGSLIPLWCPGKEAVAWPSAVLADFQSGLSNLVAFGQRHFLLVWRKDWLLGWRRGLPGFQISSLYGLVCQARALSPTPEAQQYLSKHEGLFVQDSRRFLARAKEYLILEREALARGSGSSPVLSNCAQAQKIREELIGPFPGQQGLYSKLMSRLEGLIYRLLSG